MWKLSLTWKLGLILMWKLHLNLQVCSLLYSSRFHSELDSRNIAYLSQCALLPVSLLLILVICKMQYR